MIDHIFQAALRVVYLACCVALIGMGLAGCEERYRYACQNPDNFHKPECVKPKCQFTQQCPEYLVAPILEKQIEPAKAAANQAQ